MCGELGHDGQLYHPASCARIPAMRGGVVLGAEDRRAGDEGVGAGARHLAMLSALMPPSTSSQMSACRARRCASAPPAIFGSAEAMNCWPPKPGLTDISSTRSSLSSMWSRHDSGVAGLNTSPALQPCSLISASVRSTCSVASGWKLMMPAPALAKSGHEPVDRLHHQVHVDRHLGVRLDRLAHQRPDGEVGHVMVVHHVEVDQVGAGGDHGAHLLAQPREVRGKDARRDAERPWRARVYNALACRRRSNTEVDGTAQSTQYHRPTSRTRRRAATSSPTPSRIRNSGNVAAQLDEPPLDHHRRRRARCRKCAAWAWSASSRC